MLNIESLMASLSEDRPIFHVEADFQHSLAWKIHETLPDTQVRLEYPFSHEKGRRRYLDIWLPTERIAIELKYATQKLKGEVNGEIFELRPQAAEDLLRYDFLKDIRRLEQAVASRAECRAGFAVLLTNNRLYWELPQNTRTVDSAFRIHEGREVVGPLAWAKHAGAGTIKGREEDLDLIGSYNLRWQGYATIAGHKNGEFRYLAVPVS